MNIAILSLVIVIIIILLWTCSAGKINTKELDKNIMIGWWRGSQDFIDQAGLKYMFIRFESSADNKYIGYIAAGDEEGMIYNNPIVIKLSTIKSDSEYKGKYELYNVDGKTPFPNKSIVTLDRLNCSLSVYEGDTLYGHFVKS